MSLQPPSPSRSIVATASTPTRQRMTPDERRDYQDSLNRSASMHAKYHEELMTLCNRCLLKAVHGKISEEESTRIKADHGKISAAYEANQSKERRCRGLLAPGCEDSPVKPVALGYVEADEGAENAQASPPSKKRSAAQAFVSGDVTALTPASAQPVGTRRILRAKKQTVNWEPIADQADGSTGTLQEDSMTLFKFFLEKISAAHEDYEREERHFRGLLAHGWGGQQASQSSGGRL